MTRKLLGLAILICMAVGGAKLLDGGEPAGTRASAARQDTLSFPERQEETKKIGADDLLSVDRHETQALAAARGVLSAFARPHNDSECLAWSQKLDKHLSSFAKDLYGNVDCQQVGYTRVGKTWVVDMGAPTDLSVTVYAITDDGTWSVEVDPSDGYKATFIKKVS